MNAETKPTIPEAIGTPFGGGFSAETIETALKGVAK